MGNNISLDGTTHIRALLNAALESETGISLRGITKGRATNIRGHLHALRHEDRKRSAKMFPDPSDPGHGKSAYDCLITEIVPSSQSSEASEEELDQEPLVNLRIMKSGVALDGATIIDEATGQEISLEDFK